jgi:hypothetical protein
VSAVRITGAEARRLREAGALDTHCDDCAIEATSVCLACGLPHCDRHAKHTTEGVGTWCEGPNGPTAADLACEVEALEAERDAARASLEAEREKAAQHCGAVADIVWQGGKAEADEALDAMRERTERNEAALRVVALWLGGPHQSSQAADVEALARAKGAELDALRAIIEGRTTPPTREEAEAHFAGGGSFRVRFDDGTSLECFEPSHLRMARRASMTSHWWALDSTGRPCAWPTTEAPDAR